MRHVQPSSTESRAVEVKKTGGEPMVEFSGDSNEYIDYHRNDLLLSLIHLRSDSPDEHIFMIMTQVTELLLKGLHFELANMQHRITEDDISGALLLAPRAEKLTRAVADTWLVLSTITPDGFNQFRNYLGTSSGQQSYMYRHVEFVLGNKSRRLAQAHSNNPDVWPALKAALEGPSLYDDVIALMARRGLPIEKASLTRDFAEEYKARKDVRDAWFEVYSQPTGDNDLYLLGEALLNIAQTFTDYRWKHLVGVQRIIGMKVGTGGSAGVGWLKTVTEHRFFPELWSIRTGLGV